MVHDLYWTAVCHALIESPIWIGLRRAMPAPHLIHCPLKGFLMHWDLGFSLDMLSQATWTEMNWRFWDIRRWSGGPRKKPTLFSRINIYWDIKDIPPLSGALPQKG